MGKVAIQKFLYALRDWGLPMTAGTLLFDLLISKQAPAWPWQALFKYSFYLVLCTALITLFRWKHLGPKASTQPSAGR